MEKIGIPFNYPHIPEMSKKYVQVVLESNHQQGDGAFTLLASEKISRLSGGGKVLLTTSCTHALEMASILLNLGPGDEVIIPSYTFTSAAIAVSKFGATPVFVDIDEKSACIDIEKVTSALSPRTKAISWVNYAGNTPDLVSLRKIAEENDLYLIEDNAHSLGGVINGVNLGSVGDFATQSFHATKNFQCGEGGALIINNPEFFNRSEIIREKGTNRKQFVRGEVSKYQWVDLGSSYLPAEMLSAILLGQLESFDYIQNLRRAIWDAYFERLVSDCDLERFEVQLPLNNDKTAGIAHMFYVIVKENKRRNHILDYGKSMGVQFTSHYEPLHNSVAGLKYGKAIGSFAQSLHTSDGIVRFPLWPDLRTKDIEKTIDVFLKALLNVEQ